MLFANPSDSPIVFDPYENNPAFGISHADDGID